MIISVVSTVFNDKKSLKTIMETVLSQTYTDIEHCIVDGGSEDGSVELLQEYEAKYREAGKVLKWFSEKDSGLYDGINKACNMATGDYMIWCTDPYYSKNSIAEIAEEIKKQNYDYVYGGIIFQKDGVITRQWSGKPGNWKLGWMAANSTLCYKRELFHKHGPYDISYKSAADYKFQVKLFQDTSLKSSAIIKPLVIFCAGGASNGGVMANLISIKEDFRVMRECNVKFGWFAVICKIIIAFFAYAFASRKKFDLEEHMK
ncbi:MAG: glycosyltransferase [Ruminococcus sp.]|nr:glycosyltransferase [Ruminococcus sp.]